MACPNVYTQKILLQATHYIITIVIHNGISGNRQNDNNMVDSGDLGMDRSGKKSGTPSARISADIDARRQFISKLSRAATLPTVSREGYFVHCRLKNKRRNVNESAIYFRCSEPRRHGKPLSAIDAHFRCLTALSNTISNFIFIQQDTARVRRIPDCCLHTYDMANSVVRWFQNCAVGFDIS